MPVDVSLVMPVWQPRPAWLVEAVRSALAEDGCSLELIVVDDGNDRPVAELLTGTTDPRLRHLRVPHGGASAARNAGTAAATGAFLRFVDADDVVAPGSTARLLALAAPGAIAYEDTVVCDEQLVPRSTIRSRLAGDVAVACLMGGFDCRHVSMLFPAEAVRRAGPWDTGLRVREDFDFVLRCVEQAPVVAGEGTATLYRRHAASATRTPQAVADAEHATRVVLEGFFRRHPELRGSPTEREAWRRVHAAEAGTALHLGRPVRAARRAVPLLRLAPREAAGIWWRAGRSAVRLSGAATARTTARARARLRAAAR